MRENAIFLGTQTASSEGGVDRNAAGVPTLQSLGAILRDRRESAGIPLAEVEDTTRIRQKYLAAIEADEWHLLPGEVVGRGFLRNYAYFLNLDPNQMIDRRRSMVDSSLSRTLAGTSTGVRLPPARPVDYRPHDVDLEHTAFSTHVSGFFESMRDWMVPILAALLIVFIVLIALWGARQMSGQFGVIFSTIQDRLSSVARQNQNGQSDGSGGQNEGEPGVAPVATLVVPAPTSTPSATPTPPPTATNTPLPTATETPLPLPAATETPSPTPTAEPTEEPTEEPPPQPVQPPRPPPIVPAVCADSRLAISSPGVNQTVSGVVPITGRAVHERFDSYKLEYAPGANATQGFTWFDGSDRTGSGGVKGSPVGNGTLGHFNSAGVANAAYTLRLTVVDMSSNYPEPCQVTINVQN
jgi:cytoskeletal protein RodZ